MFLELSIEKELKSIQNEFDLSFTNADSKRSQIMVDSALSNCRYKRFSWGSLESLSQPIDILKKKLVEYYDEFYIPERMSICVYSRLELNELEKFIKENFIDYQPKGPNFSQPDFKYEKDELSLEDYLNAYRGLYFIESSKEDNYIVLTWFFQPEIDNYKSKPLNIICDFLEEEGPNSLHKYLKDNGLINYLSATFIM